MTSYVIPQLVLEVPILTISPLFMCKTLWCEGVVSYDELLHRLSRISVAHLCQPEAAAQHEVTFRLFSLLATSVYPLHPPTHTHTHTHPPSPTLLLCIIDGCPGPARRFSIQASVQLCRMHFKVCVFSSCTSVGCISLSQGGVEVVFHQQEKVSPI